MEIIAKIENRYKFIIPLIAFSQIFIISVIGAIVTFFLINIFNKQLATPANPIFHFLNSCMMITIIITGITLLPYHVVLLFRQRKKGAWYNLNTLILTNNGLYLQLKPEVSEFFPWDEIKSIKPSNKYLSYIMNNYSFYEFQYTSKWEISDEAFIKTTNQPGDKLRFMITTSEYNQIIRTMKANMKFEVDNAIRGKDKW